MQQPLSLDEIEARAAAATKGPWTVSEDYDDVLDSQGAHLASYWNPSSQIRNGEFIAHARTDVPAMAAEIRRLRAALDEMTHCRDNALRALYRDDVDTDIDLEETIGAPFYGPGWDWDEADLQCVVSEAANAVRPAFGKLTQQRDKAREKAREHGELAARRESELIALRARVTELEGPAIEAKRNEIRQSFTEIAAQCEQDHDYEAAHNFQRRLREHEEQWAREDAVEETHVVADDSSGPEPYRFVDDDGDYLHIGIPASPACGGPAISFHTATEPVHVPVDQIGGLIAALRRLAAVRP